MAETLARLRASRQPRPPSGTAGVCPISSIIESTLRAAHARHPAGWAARVAPCGPLRNPPAPPYSLPTSNSYPGGHAFIQPSAQAPRASAAQVDPRGGPESGQPRGRRAGSAAAHLRGDGLASRAGRVLRSDRRSGAAHHLASRTAGAAGNAAAHRRAAAAHARDGARRATAAGRRAAVASGRGRGPPGGVPLPRPPPPPPPAPRPVLLPPHG